MLSISDVTGKKSFYISGYHDQFVFDVSALPKGVYLLHAQSANGRQVAKFVKG